MLFIFIEVIKLSIQYLKISNFKSIDSLELKNINDFSVFAGANGSGKSNFFDALDFVSRFIRFGLTDALRGHGGFNNIHSVKREARQFEFEIECTLPEDSASYKYRLVIEALDTEPEINEQLFIDEKKAKALDSVDYSVLFTLPRLPLSTLLKNVRIYRIEPFGASAPDQSDQDSSQLKRNAHNLPSVLKRLEQNDNLRETILEWMETIVPGIQQIQTEHQNLTGSTAILFKEQGAQFPAHMMSDGTIYALSLLVTVLDTPSAYGLTLIEEPERGLHPQAIFELINLIRDQAVNPIWMSTHSESVVRQLKLDELWLVDKKNGKTQMKAAASGRLQQSDLAPLGMDEAWLSNLLGGGLPW